MGGLSRDTYGGLWRRRSSEDALSRSFREESTSLVVLVGRIGKLVEELRCPRDFAGKLILGMIDV